MPELRWLLLILGLLFVGVLAWREMRRPRRPSAPPQEPQQHQPHHFREPTLGLPEIRAREPAQELPVVEIDDDSMIGLRVDGMRIEEELQSEELAEAEPAEEVNELSRVTSVPESPEPIEPIVDWPPEDQRKLVALRIAAQPGDRFAGRALRLALTAEGFVLGKFDIFHKPGADGRVLVSAASLTQPGTFDLETMDMHRYGGLGLFTVLPGPLPGREMFDELLATARMLSARLEGTLQDERGEPLTSVRAASLRERLEPQDPEREAQP